MITLNPQLPFMTTHLLCCDRIALTNQDWSGSISALWSEPARNSCRKGYSQSQRQSRQHQQRRHQPQEKANKYADKGAKSWTLFPRKRFREHHPSLLQDDISIAHDSLQDHIRNLNDDLQDDDYAAGSHADSFLSKSEINGMSSQMGMNPFRSTILLQIRKSFINQGAKLCMIDVCCKRIVSYPTPQFTTSNMP